MEQELQMPSCLFGGPPVRDDIIKLGESQIGFMNIFACPLFEAVTDILPAMRFAVDEILANKAVWERKIDSARQKKRKSLNLSLGLPSPSFAVDATPSPFSGGPTRSIAEVSAQAPDHGVSDETTRRGSSGSIHTTVMESRRSSLGGEKGSRRVSAGGLVGQHASSTREAQGSRRGSGDASLTAILVTQTPNASESFLRDSTSKVDDQNRGSRKDTLTQSASKKKEKGGTRPVTAPSQARRSPGKHRSTITAFPQSWLLTTYTDIDVNLYPLPQPSSQSHSQVDLSSTANGNLDGSRLQQWESNKISGDSNMTRSDVSRNSSWWRQMSTRRTTRDTRNGDADIRVHPPKEMMLDTPPSNADSTATSPTCPSPGRKTTTGKIKNFFKRKPRHDEQQKQLSSFGSSSQLRTPPTSDPGRSLNSDD
jgi:hypothetical protein